MLVIAPDNRVPSLFRSSGSLAGPSSVQRPWVKRRSSSLPTGLCFRTPPATRASQVGTQPGISTSRAVSAIAWCHQ
jgi:hypothetical protein